MSAPPSSGRFIIEPRTGVAGSDVFRLKLENWEDDGLNPVTYELRYIDPETNGAVPLISRTRTNEFFTVLPPVTREDQDWELTILAYIINKDKAKAEVRTTIKLRLPDLTHDADMSLCLDALSPLDLGGCGESGTRVRVICENATAPFPGCPCNVDPLPSEYLAAVSFWATKALEIQNTTVSPSNVRLA